MGARMDLPHMPKANAKIKEYIEKYNNKEADYLGLVNQIFDLEEDTEEKPNKMEKITYLINKLLSNKDFIQKTKSLDLQLECGSKYKLSDEEIKKCTENPFKKYDGSATSVAKEIFDEYKLDPNKPEICIEIFADETFCGCGLLSQWETQEETTIRDMNPEFLAHFLGTKCIKEKTIKNKPNEVEKRFPYDRKKLSTSDGYIIQAELCMDGLTPLEKPIKVYLLFTSLPSLTDEKDSFDENGTASWLFKNLEQKNVPSEKINEKAILHLVKTFLERKRKNIIKIRGDQFKRALILLMFDENSIIQKDDPRTIEEKINEIIGLADSEDNDKFKEAEQNYKDLMRKTFSRWIKLAREKGVKYFIGGPIGCGAFRNDSTVVAENMAGEFVKNGGEMKYCYASFDGTEDDTFEDAFNEAFNNNK